MHSQRAQWRQRPFFFILRERVYLSARPEHFTHPFQNNPKRAQALYCIEARALTRWNEEGLPHLFALGSVWTQRRKSQANRLPKGSAMSSFLSGGSTRNVMRYDEPFDPRYSRQIAYNDPAIGISYPISNPILAPHDLAAPHLADSDLNL
jgi:dTDP-4-dehydrorhamnose 3,5-epimerase